MSDEKFVCWRDADHQTGETRWGWPQCTVCQAAPQYHERKPKQGLTLDIYVPRLDEASGWRSRLLVATLRPGTAIVGYRREGHDDAIDSVISYEGWIYGNMDALTVEERWKTGLLHAAGRLITEYPTTAVQFARSVDLTVVGTYDPHLERTAPGPIEVTDQDALDLWLQEAA